MVRVYFLVIRKSVSWSGLLNSSELLINHSASCEWIGVLFSWFEMFRVCNNWLVKGATNGKEWSVARRPFWSVLFFKGMLHIWPRLPNAYTFLHGPWAPHKLKHTDFLVYFSSIISNSIVPEARNCYKRNPESVVPITRLPASSNKDQVNMKQLFGFLLISLLCGTITATKTHSDDSDLVLSENSKLETRGCYHYNRSLSLCFDIQPGSIKLETQDGRTLVFDQLLGQDESLLQILGARFLR